VYTFRGGGVCGIVLPRARPHSWSTGLEILALRGWFWQFCCALGCCAAIGTRFAQLCPQGRDSWRAPARGPSKMQLGDTPLHRGRCAGCRRMERRPVPAATSSARSQARPATPCRSTPPALASLASPSPQ